MRMARADAQDLNGLREFFQDLEELIENGYNSPDEIANFVCERASQLTGWRRVVGGYEVLFNNACNPDRSYLEWKSEIIEALANCSDWEWELTG